MLFILTFFLIFGWKITIYLDISAMLASGLAIYFVFREHDTTHWRRVVTPLLALSLYSAVIILITGLTDLQPFLRAFRAFTMLIAAFSLYTLYSKYYQEPAKKLSKDIFFSISLHAIIMLAMYCSTGLREEIYSLTQAFDYVNHQSPIINGLRVSGLTYALSQTSLLQLFAIILLPTVLTQKNSNAEKTLIIFSIPLIIISIFISGRSGFFIGAILFIGYIMLNSATNESLFSFLKGNLKKILLYSSALLFLSALVFYSLPSKFTDYSLATSKEIFNAFRFQGTTFQNLKSMYFLPESNVTILFGKGNYGRTPSFYLESDVGWIKSIFAIGIIGNLIMVIPFLWGIKEAFKQRKFLGQLAIALILILLGSLILNFKELSLLTRNQWTVQAILIAILTNAGGSKNKLGEEKA